MGSPLPMRTARVHGASLAGTGAELITVEARFEEGKSSPIELTLSGLPDTVIRESRGRLQSAMKAIGMHLPSGKLFLNLVPSGRRKSGDMLDLALTLAAATAVGHLTPGRVSETLFLGEIGIDGQLHAVPGGLAATTVAMSHGLKRVVAPLATAREAALARGVQAFGMQHLKEVIAYCCGDSSARPLRPEATESRPTRGRALAEVRGQPVGLRALEVAAAGGHALLFLGPPGIGKSLLARAMIELMPPPTYSERLDIAGVRSISGKYCEHLSRRRPFRAPHHTVSFAGLVGGGNPPVAGEATRAHGGLLFLDELPEFRREALESLRVPLESGTVRISRAGHQVKLPAHFQLVCAMNPCPCGFLGHPRAPCRCSQREIDRYRRRISGPLLDRLELRVELESPSIEELLPRASQPAQAESSSQEARETPVEETADLVRIRKIIARALRARRRALHRQGCSNSELGTKALDFFAPLCPGQRRVLKRTLEFRDLSARAIQALRRVARTLADIEGSGPVTERHFAGALALRAPLEVRRR